MSLAARLLLGMVALVLLTSATSAGLSYRSMHQTLINQGLQALADESARNAADFDEIVERIRSEVATLAAYRALEADLRPEWMGQERPAELMMARLRSEPAYRRIVALDVAGREVLGVERDASGKALLHRVTESPGTDAGVASPLVLLPETIEFGPGPVLRIARLAGAHLEDSAGYVVADIDLQALLAPAQRRAAQATLFLVEMRPDGGVWSAERPRSEGPDGDFSALVAAFAKGAAPALVLPSRAGGDAAECRWPAAGPGCNTADLGLPGGGAIDAALDSRSGGADDGRCGCAGGALGAFDLATAGHHDGGGIARRRHPRPTLAGRERR